MLVKKVNILLLTLLTLLSTTVSAAVNTQYSATVCGSGKYLFGCEALTSSGPAQNVLGDSTVHLNLLFAAPKATEYTATIEPGQIYLFGCDQVSVDGSTASQTLQQAGCGCDSTVTLTLRVQAPVTPTKVVVGYEATIEPGQTYLFGCQQLTAAGEYKDTLHLAGKDSITVLTLKVESAAPTEVKVGYEATIEPGQTYLFGCQQLTAAGEYKDTLHLAGKDSITVLTLKVESAAPTVVKVGYEATIEPGQTYLFGCQQLTAAGEYKDTLHLAGKDSITVLTLKVESAAPTEVKVGYEATIEPGQTYLFGCRQLTAAGEYKDTLHLAGKDSITVLTLKVESAAPTEVKVGYEATIEPGQTYLFGCRQLIAAGEYKDTLHLAGKDSITVLTLKVESATPTVVKVGYEATIEPGQTYLFGCQQLTAAGEYKDTLHLAGKDSITVLTLKVESAAPTEVKVGYEATIEPGQTYLFGCRQLTAAGEYKDTLHLAGKDSITVLTLKVESAAPTEVKVGYEATIEPGQTYLFGCQQLTAAGEYKDTLHLAGKDSITVLTLKVESAAPTEVKVGYEATIEPGQTYLFGCRQLIAAGEYKDTLHLVGKDSITVLTLSIAAVPQPVDTAVAYTATIQEGETYLFGCAPLTIAGTYDHTLPRVGILGDSTITLTLNVLPAAVPAVPETYTMCDDGIGYTWVGHESLGFLTTSGTYYDTIRYAASGYDSAYYELSLTVLYPAYGTDEVIGCDSVIFKGTKYIASTTVMDTLVGMAANGCDSIVTVAITVNAHAEGADALEGCESVSFKGITYTADALVYDTIVGGAANGCDSIVAVSITVKHAALGADVLEGCDSVIFKGVKYTADALVYDTIVGGAANGCDSIVAVSITVHAHAEGTKEIEGCDSVIFNGVKYTADALVYDTVAGVAANGCDSIYAVTITIKHSSVSEETAVDCDSYEWNGQTYMASGDYTFTTKNALGCDSVVTLHLTINKSVAVTETPDPVCYSYYWSEVDTTIVNTGSYTHVFQTIHGCDSTVTLNVTVNAPYVDTLDVRSYYGDRIIMINRHQINSIPGWTAALDSIDTGAGYVKWYKMSGTTPDPETDEQVGTGYYYTLPTGDPIPAGRYYATVEIPASDAAMCGALGTTEIYTVAGASPAPALMPSLARPGEDIRVINLDPEVETEIRIYSAEGMLIEKTAVSGEPYYIIHAAAETGFYLVEVVSDSMKSTLRYIVK